MTLNNTTMLGVVYTLSTHKILCAWHIHRAWQKALRDHLKDKSDQINVYYTLCVLLQERDEPTFLTTLHNNHSVFFTNYCCHIKQWATCFRINCTANTNTFVEAFHSVLKTVYLQKKQNRRVDCLLLHLMKFARNILFERFRKLEMGKKNSQDQ